MLNIHLNGDVVRCPDIAAAKYRVQHKNDCEKRCKFGVRESDCKVFNTYALTYKKFGTRCDCDTIFCRDYKEFTDESGILWRHYHCPKMHKQYINSLKAKSFVINRETYRRMSSAAHDLIKSSKHWTLFLTLTFPPFKIEPNEKQINQCFSKFVENIRRNYNCSGYVAVREYGENTNRVHFHLICSMPFTSFTVLNAAWCHSISTFCDFSASALRTTKDTIRIKSPVKALRYVCKYFSMSRGTTSKTRLVFISNNLIKKPIQRFCTIEDILKKDYKGIFIQQTSDYSTLFRITDEKSFMRFANEYLYPEFEIEYKYPLFSKKIISFTSPASDFVP